jgi:hypothetical protein
VSDDDVPRPVARGRQVVGEEGEFFENTRLEEEVKKFSRIR